MTEHPCNLPPLFDIEGHGPIHVDGVKITATYGGRLAGLPTMPTNQATLQRAVEAASAPHKAVYLAPVAAARRPDLTAVGSPPDLFRLTVYTPVYTLPSMTNTALRSMRLSDELWQFADEYARDNDGVKDRSDLVRQLLEALHEDRLVVKPRPAPNPFPADELRIKED